MALPAFLTLENWTQLPNSAPILLFEAFGQSTSFGWVGQSVCACVWRCDKEKKSENERSAHLLVRLDWVYEAELA